MANREQLRGDATAVLTALDWLHFHTTVLGIVEHDAVNWSEFAFGADVYTMAA